MAAVCKICENKKNVASMIVYSSNLGGSVHEKCLEKIQDMLRQLNPDPLKWKKMLFPND